MILQSLSMRIMNQKTNSMNQYIKKPMTISAVQWTGSNRVEIDEFFDGNDKGEFKGDGLFISTLEGTMRASKGDYIIQGIEGEFYPCKPGIFEKTYNVAGNVSDNCPTVNDLNTFKKMIKETKLIPIEGMPPYQIRVVDEHNDLVEKYNALIAFSDGVNFQTVSPSEGDRLKLQASIMKSYILVLKQRISNFN